MGSPKLGIEVMALESHRTGLVRNKLRDCQAVREHQSEMEQEFMNFGNYEVSS